MPRSRRGIRAAGGDVSRETSGNVAVLNVENPGILTDNHRYLPITSVAGLWAADRRRPAVADGQDPFSTSRRWFTHFTMSKSRRSVNYHKY